MSDKWAGTLVAVRKYRQQHGLTEITFPHEIVAHSKGEIVNDGGFSTNAIEDKWSVLKRWLRRRLGGFLPGRADRATWKKYIEEFQFRKLVKSEVRTDRLPPNDPQRAHRLIECSRALADYRKASA